MDPVCDGTLKNLTRAAGYGVEGMQDARAIAVREPSVHWDGTKALFSMVVGAPPRQYEWGEHYWQIYEISGLGWVTEDGGQGSLAKLNHSRSRPPFTVLR